MRTLDRMAAMVTLSIMLSSCSVDALFNATSEKVGLKTRLALDELTALRAKVKAQAEALTLAANRLDRLSLECPHGSSIRFDAEEWGDTARRAAQEAGQE